MICRNRDDGVARKEHSGWPIFPALSLSTCPSWLKVIGGWWVGGPCDYCDSLSPKIRIWDFGLIFWTHILDSNFRLRTSGFRLWDFGLRLVNFMHFWANFSSEVYFAHTSEAKVSKCLFISILLKKKYCATPLYMIPEKVIINLQLLGVGAAK